MIIEKKYIKDTIYITLIGVIDEKKIKVLEKELIIIIDKIGILKISINMNNAYFMGNMNSLLTRIKNILIVKDGKLFLVDNKRKYSQFLTYKNEYLVFNSNFI